MAGESFGVVERRGGKVLRTNGRRRFERVRRMGVLAVGDLRRMRFNIKAKNSLSAFSD